MEELESHPPEVAPEPAAARKMRMWSVEDIEQLDRDRPILSRTIAWIRDYLARPHPLLGRTGVVCPFVPRALSLNQLYLSVVWPTEVTEEYLEEVLIKYRAEFLNLTSRSQEDASFKAIIIILPGVTAQFIESIQSRMKVRFVDVGLMLGEFHEDNYSPGLHNAEFRPLRSPMPMLAIRHVVESDLVFLMRSTDPVALRIQFLRGYLRALGPTLSPAKAETARAALQQAEAELHSVQAGSVG